MRRALFLLLAVAALACARAAAPDAGPRALPSGASPTPALAGDQTAPRPPDTGWVEVRPGLGRREVDARPPGAGATPAPLVRLILFRVSPAHFRFRVRYSPGQPLPVAVWAAQTPDAALVFNGGYFDGQHRATALVVADGAASGSSYRGFGGMFGVYACPGGPCRGGGAPFLRSLVAAPLLPGESFEQAIQSAPVLLGPGGVFDHPDPAPARRVAIAQTRGGDFVLVFAPDAVFSLGALAGWLAASDLELELALNLDGGSSAGYWRTREDWRDSYVPVPVVVVVEPG